MFIMLISFSPLRTEPIYLLKCIDSTCARLFVLINLTVRNLIVFAPWALFEIWNGLLHLW